MSGQVWAIVPAAGVGKRMAAERPKQYLPLAGKTVIQHTLEKLAAVPRITGIVVALGADDDYWETLDIRFSCPLETVTGGAERVHSVYNAASAIAADLDTDDWLLVHDAARPCVRVTDIARLLDAVATHPCGGLLATPASDTLKQAGAGRVVEKTLDRSRIWHALTPQCFRAPLLLEALEKGLQHPAAITDEASAMEAMGHRPLLVQGRSDNLKITRPEDLALAEFYLQRENHHD